VEFLRADMGDAAEVLPARGRGARAERSIDVLIHSAGGMPPSGRREVLDRGFTQNLLGAFLLTRPLEERLLARALCAAYYASFNSGLEWAIQGRAWAKAFDLLKAFVQDNGNSEVPIGHVEAGYPLGQWVWRVRRLYSEGRLPEVKVHELERLPNWTWTQPAGVRCMGCG
jgi:NAD(P)-dependent dehydrogenase (short-subunit alcohol dehydrogenase family)